MRKVSTYRELEIWQLSMNVVNVIQRIAAKFSRSEVYGLTSQMRRAAISLPSNIAEGFMRESRKDFAHFITIAKGSLAELETQTTIALRFGYIDQELHDGLLKDMATLSKKLTLFRRRMRESAKR